MVAESLASHRLGVSCVVAALCRTIIILCCFVQRSLSLYSMPVAIATVRGTCIAFVLWVKCYVATPLFFAEKKEFFIASKGCCFKTQVGRGAFGISSIQ